MASYKAQINASVRRYVDLEIEAESQEEAERIAAAVVGAINAGDDYNEIEGVANASESDGDGSLYDAEVEGVGEETSAGG